VHLLKASAKATGTQSKRKRYAIVGPPPNVDDDQAADKDMAKEEKKEEQKDGFRDVTQELKRSARNKTPVKYPGQE
jgi:hypothetical protein